MSPRSVLVVKPSSLGDVVHTLPAVSLLKRAWPETRLRWIVNPEWAPLLEGNPDVDEIILFPRRELSGSFTKQLRWLRATGKACRSDLVLDFQGLLRSAIMVKWFGYSVSLALAEPPSAAFCSNCCAFSINWLCVQ